MRGNERRLQVIEKIAAAIYLEFENRPLNAQLQMNGVLATELAIAALRAMKVRAFGDLPEPMALAGEEAIDRAKWGTYRAAHEVWAAMVDAALCDAPPSVK